MLNRKSAWFGLPQNLVAGLVLLAVALLALCLTSDLTQGTLSAMGAGLLPRWLALAMAACGVVLVVTALQPQDEPPEQVPWRGVALVLVAIIGFAMMIRPFSLGPLALPGLGLIIAGPFAVIVAGLATPEARLRELFILASVLTAFCMLLFGDLLNLPIPIFPQFLAGYVVGLPAKTLLRAAAAVLALIGIATFAQGHYGARRPHAALNQKTETPHD
ncbi:MULTISPECIES: tripartite tricarboxylate transporter TctB family protein [Rhizobium/Agrobacterium group]|uniref:tripartite tricarboxylate transporter TctB family protein n=1 Tax=Rhizobium/Agrobacterium group TaxID=227290 RepID=UPI0018D26E7E|nr:MULTISPECIES: tripartite tricarboxylate transporter TctB family protein [Rhizobium/Agrobacterium group]